MKAAVLGIGTELTYGQIINKNAPWISERLKKFGFLTDFHLTVPDDRTLILQSLDFLKTQHCQLIFLTGGLGPTSDDFTREIISQWTHKKLIFNDSAWAHVVQTLEQRGIQAREIQKQQCYFPETATVLNNRVGTAQGFYLQHDDTHFFILPGPPREINSIWMDFIQAWLQQKSLDLKIDKLITMSWDTLGWPESEVATAVEDLFKNSNPKPEIGYRVHLPYVEVKISYLESQKELFLVETQKLEQILKPITITTQGEDLVEQVVQQIKNLNIPIAISDFYTGLFLLNRIQPQIVKHNLHISYSNNETLPINSEGINIKIDKIDDHTCNLNLQHKEKTQTLILASPVSRFKMGERSQQSLVELILIEMKKFLHFS